MRKYFTLWFSLLLAMMLTGAVAAQETVEADSEAYKEKDLFADCNREAPALQALIDYFRTFYDDDVVKTGSFHQLEELADDRGDGAEDASGQTPETVSGTDSTDADSTDADSTDADSTGMDSTDADSADADSGKELDYQYVLYCGTNDKDTNEPVGSREECMETAKKILIDRFGGYTIQEAEGGWVGDDGKVFQEFTMVIFLSDTTKDQVHAAADELIQAFRQSSILIQENPTKTEFYAG